MRFLGIIPDKVIHELSIKVTRFIQVVDVEVDALLLDGTVESLQEAVRLGMPGVVKEVGQAVLLAEVIKVFGEFTAIVCLDSPGDKRSDLKELPDEITAIGRRVSLVGIGKSEAGVDINGSEDIAFRPAVKTATVSI